MPVFPRWAAALGLGDCAINGIDLMHAAGGATTAITWDLMRAERGADRPGRIAVSDISQGRLDGLRRFHAGLGSGVPVDYVLAEGTGGNDALLDALPEGSLVVNATGLGKDRPGSPLGPDARFPRGGFVWELNCRGNLLFLDAAEAQVQPPRRNAGRGGAPGAGAGLRRLARGRGADQPPRADRHPRGGGCDAARRRASGADRRDEAAAERDAVAPCPRPGRRGPLNHGRT